MKKISATLIAIFFSGFVSAQGQLWCQKGLDIDGDSAGDKSGTTVSMPDANTVAIGAPLNSGQGGVVGNVRIFSWSGSVWIQKGSEIEGEAVNDISGWALSMPDSNTIAIGAPYNDGSGIQIIGQVRVYTWTGIYWEQKGADIDGEAFGDMSGWSVSMPDSNTVAIGSYENSGNGSESGHVRIYKWNGSAWQQKGSDIDGEHGADYSGWSVSMPDSNTVAIGATKNSDSCTYAGQVRIFSWTGNAWVQKGGNIRGKHTYDGAGQSVSMPDCNTVAIGAPQINNGGGSKGLVQIFIWNGIKWIQKGYDINGESNYNYSGYSVSMPDSNTVAIGANWNSGSGNHAGHVRVYVWNNNGWIQSGNDIDGESSEDESGYYVNMPNANTVAVGAPLNDGNGIDAGHIRVYTISAMGINNAISMRCVNIFPNPSNGIVTIEYVENGNLPFEITDVTGRIIAKGFLASSPATLDLSNETAGVYLIEIFDNGALTHLKIIKE